MKPKYSFETNRAQRLNNWTSPNSLSENMFNLLHLYTHSHPLTLSIMHTHFLPLRHDSSASHRLNASVDRPIRVEEQYIEECVQCVLCTSRHCRKSKRRISTDMHTNTQHTKSPNCAHCRTGCWLLGFGLGCLCRCGSPSIYHNRAESPAAASAQTY